MLEKDGHHPFLHIYIYRTADVSLSQKVYYKLTQPNPSRTGDHISTLPSGRPSSPLVFRAGTLCQLKFLMTLFRNNRYSKK